MLYQIIRHWMDV